MESPGLFEGAGTVPAVRECMTVLLLMFYNVSCAMGGSNHTTAGAGDA
jgi:hypothetical protein